MANTGLRMSSDELTETRTAPDGRSVPQRSVRPMRRRRFVKTLTPYLFVLPAVLFLALLLVYPIVLNIQMSFQDRKLGNLIDGPTPWVGLANYRAAFRLPAFSAAAWHSVVFTVSAVTIQFVFGLLLALFFFQNFRGARTMRALFLVAYAIPIVVSAEVFRWLLDGRGLVNTLLHDLHLQSSPTYWLSDLRLALPALIVVEIWLGLPFTMVNLMAGLATVPRELYEAASIDGANAWSRFWHVTWPLIRPTAAAAIVLSLIFCFKTFDLVWIATQGGPGTASELLPTLAYRTAFIGFDFGVAAAILNIVFAVCFVLALAYIVSLRREEAVG